MSAAVKISKLTDYMRVIRSKTTRHVNVAVRLTKHMKGTGSRSAQLNVSSRLYVLLLLLT